MLERVLTVPALAGSRPMAKRIEPVDALVGRRVRAYRLSMGMSQTTLGEKVGVTFQQIQKYERGTNRIGSSRLKKVATVLGVGVGALFAEPESDQAGQDPLTEITSLPHAARLLKAFAGITDEKLRLALVKLAEGLQERAK
ncbi:MAG: helix-turn-helix transcriptional regulator [Xanthobacteraceae bacterium]